MGSPQHFGGGGHGGGANSDLVQQVKDLQKSDPVAKEQWQAWTDTHGGGTRDPAKHPPDFLDGFLNNYRSGTRIQAAAPGGGASYTDIIKMLQKKSPNFKVQWQNYCNQFGGGTMDPNKHDAEFQTNFFDYLATVASGGGGPGLIPAPMAAMAGPAPGRLALVAPGGGGMMGGPPPAKRMRDSFGLGAPMGMDPQKQAMVDAVKAYQRSGPNEKEAWGNYADQFLNGVKDPARHDAETLQSFMATHGVSAAGPGGGDSRWPAATPQGVDPMKDELVSRIKAFQKQGNEQKDMWSGFCGATRDPARHPVEKLQEFCNTYGV